MPSNQVRGKMTEPHLYDFISGFKNVEEVHLTTHQICGGDIIDSIKRLAENDTIKTLHLSYFQHDIFIMRGYTDCVFQNKPNLKSFDMKNFNHLKTIIIHGHDIELDQSFHHIRVCDPFKLLSVYSSQILSNIENLKIISIEHNWDFIKFMPKLLHLEFYVETSTFHHALKIISTLESILQKRRNEQNKGDCIEIKFRCQNIFDLFTKINGHRDSIKLFLN